MKKIMALLILFVMTINIIPANAEGFDLDIFRNQSNIEPEHTDGQYNIKIDDMEARGFISILHEGWSSLPDTRYTYSYTDYKMYSTVPDIMLVNYGTNKFFPLPRIWFYYYGNDIMLYDTVIFKIDDMTYRFEDASVSVDTFFWNNDVPYLEKILCRCDASYIDFMNAWIEYEGDIKVRIKSEEHYVDYIYPSIQQENIRLMFQNFKDAGGYELLPILN